MFGANSEGTRRNEKSQEKSYESLALVVICSVLKPRELIQLLD